MHRQIIRTEKLKWLNFRFFSIFYSEISIGNSNKSIKLKISLVNPPVFVEQSLFAFEQWDWEPFEVVTQLWKLKKCFLKIQETFAYTAGNLRKLLSIEITGDA